MKKPNKTSEWPETIKQFHSSGMSAAQFSRDNNLNYHALNYHLRKLRNNKNDSSQLQNFIELPVEKSSKVEMLPEIQINMNSGLLTICFQAKS